MNTTSNAVVSTFTQSAVNSIALEQAALAAREALKGETPNAWAAASAIANACNAQAFAGSTKAVIFGIAAKLAADGFAAARIAGGALKDDSKWLAFASSASVARGALEFSVWVEGIGKSEAAKGVKANKEAQESANYALAVEAGIVPAQSTPESLNLALTKELATMRAEHDLNVKALKAAQERLIPIDSVNAIHAQALEELNAKLSDAYAVADALRVDLAKAVAAVAHKSKAKA